MVENASKNKGWFKSFIIFLLAVIVAISLGLVIYYFANDDESLKFKESDITVNVGDSFTIDVLHENSKKSIEWSINWTKTVLNCSDGTDSKKAYTFTVLDGGELDNGTTQVTLSSKKFGKLICTVHIGDGSMSHPFYIRTAEELASIGVGTGSELNYRGLDKNYIQLNDIDLKEYGNWTSLGGDTGFSGRYNGQNHIIYNMSINSMSSANVGLFTKLNSSANVMNLSFNNTTIKGSVLTAGTVAGICYGNVTGVSVEKTVIEDLTTSDGNEIGGIVGHLEKNSLNTKAKLDRVCVNNLTMNITSEHAIYVGGLVGYGKSCIIINSYSRGFISCSGNNIVAGGIAGKVMTDKSINDADLTTSKKVNIINVYSTTMVTAETAGAIVGINENGSATGNPAEQGTNSYTNSINQENRYVGVYYIYDGDTRNTFWTSTATEANINADGFELISGISIELAKNRATYKTYTRDSLNSTDYSSWNFTTIWLIQEDINDGFPTLRVDGKSEENIYDPTSSYDGLIRSQSELELVKNNLAGTYRIGANFSLTSNWTPIGTSETPFTGTLYGYDEHGNYTITVTNGISFTSLFGEIKNGFVEKLTIKGANISSGNNIGIMASVNNGTIQDCVCAGNITISGNEDKNIGGIVGINNGTIINSSAGNTGIEVVIQVSNNGDKTYHIGGIAGRNSGIIENCINYENCRISTTSETGIMYAGGIVGINVQSATIKSCSNYGNVTLTKTNENYIAGGIAGVNDGREQNTNEGFNGHISLCKVGNTSSLTIKGYYVGGLVGKNTTNNNNVLSITRSQVNEGVTLEGVNIGGLVGRMCRGTMTNCATFAYLTGDTMCGIAYTVEGSTDGNGDGEYATVDTCFSSATFNGNAGTVKAETISIIRGTNNAMYCWLRGENLSNPKSFKVAGYIINGKYNIDNLKATGQSEDSFRQHTSIQIVGERGNIDADGATSSENCKKSSTFDTSIWGADIWTIVSGKYPQIKFD